MSTKSPAAINPQMYVPGIFKDAKNDVAERIYTHFVAGCLKNASYEAFRAAKDDKGFKCPLCSSRVNSVILNKELSDQVSGFVENFGLGNKDDFKYSCDLAERFFSEGHFEYVIKICKRVLILNKDPEMKGYFKALLKESKKNFVELSAAFKKSQEKLNSLKNDLNICLERLKSSNCKIEKSLLKTFIEMYYRDILYEMKVLVQIYQSNKLQTQAINTFQGAIDVYKKCLELDIKNSELKNSVFLNLVIYLAEFGDFLFSLKCFSIAIEKYREAIEHINKAISICSDKSKINYFLILLDKCYLRLSKTYIPLAEYYFLQKNYSSASKYYKEAEKAVLNIKNKENTEIGRILKHISERLSINEDFQNMAKLIKRLNAYE